MKPGGYVSVTECKDFVSKEEVAKGYKTVTASKGHRFKVQVRCEEMRSATECNAARNMDEFVDHYRDYGKVVQIGDGLGCLQFPKDAIGFTLVEEEPPCWEIDASTLSHVKPGDTFRIRKEDGCCYTLRREECPERAVFCGWARDTT